MGHFPEFYIMVPTENFTDENWKRANEALEASGKEVSDLLTDTVFVDDLEISIYVSEEIDPDSEDYHWPIPDGMGMVSGYIWSKWGPRDEVEAGAVMATMRAIMSGMGGVYGTVANELGFGEVMTFGEFLKCHDGYIVLSSELADLADRKALEFIGTVNEFPGGIEVAMFEPFVPEGSKTRSGDKVRSELESVLDALMESSPSLHTDMERLSPDFEIDDIGVELVPRFSDWSKKAPTEVQPYSDPDEVSAWAKGVVDEGILTRDRYTIGTLTNRMHDLQRAGDYAAEREVLKEAVRYDLFTGGGLKFKNSNHVRRMATVLHELGEYEEAETHYMMVLGVFKKEGKIVDHHLSSEHAKNLWRLGRLVEAEIDYVQAIEVCNPDDDFRDFQAGLLLSDLAMIRLERGDVEGAEAAMAKAKPIAAYIGEGNPENMSKYMGIQALIAMRKGDLDRAEDLARRGVNFSWSNESAGKRDLLFNLDVLEEVLEAKGDEQGLADVRSEKEGLEASFNKWTFYQSKGSGSSD